MHVCNCGQPVDEPDDLCDACFNTAWARLLNEQDEAEAVLARLAAQQGGNATLTSHMGGQPAPITEPPLDDPWATGVIANGGQEVPYVQYTNAASPHGEPPLGEIDWQEVYRRDAAARQEAWRQLREGAR